MKGWDYSELSKEWNLPGWENDNEGELLKLYLTEVILYVAFHNPESPVVKKHANDIREYCKAMLRYPVGCTEIWKGFSEEKSNFELIRMFGLVVQLAWT